jgi:hypothetical protein
MTGGYHSLVRFFLLPFFFSMNKKKQKQQLHPVKTESTPNTMHPFRQDVIQNTTHLLLEHPSNIRYDHSKLSADDTGRQVRASFQAMPYQTFQSPECERILVNCHTSGYHQKRIKNGRYDVHMLNPVSYIQLALLCKLF